MRRGVSAVEVMCAAVILALGLVPLVSMQTRTLRQAGFTRGHALASLHGRAILDHLAAQGAQQLTSGAAVAKLAEAVAPPTGFHLKSTNAEVHEQGPGLVSIEVVLEWSVGSEKRDHRIRLTRLVSRRDHSWMVATELPSTRGLEAD